MQVKNVMSKEVIAVKRSATLKQLIGIFDKFHIFPLVPVIEEDHCLVGIASFRNLIDTLSSYDFYHNYCDYSYLRVNWAITH